MKRRNFIKTSVLCASAVSAFGFIRFDGTRYVGDCATTSDILGPFYRPGSPERSNLVVAGSKGRKLQLLGKILHQDCTTPYQNAKVELWHCDEEGVYDNSTSSVQTTEALSIRIQMAIIPSKLFFPCLMMPGED
jgi:catechol 1,2-dioxygenase